MGSVARRAPDGFLKARPLVEGDRRGHWQSLFPMSWRHEREQTVSGVFQFRDGGRPLGVRPSV
jgi:hypothetical protein